MYDLPQDTEIEEVMITRSVVEGKGKPKIKRKAKEEDAA